MADEKREFKTGDFVVCKWDVDTDDGGRENWLPVRLACVCVCVCVCVRCEVCVCVCMCMCTVCV